MAPMMKKIAQQTTDGWSDPPWWDHRTMADSRQTAVGIFPMGPGAQKWYWLDGGVNGRWQQVSRPLHKGYKPAIKFRRYVPYSRPGPRFGGAGAYTGRPVFVSAYKRYWWPGIQPRNFAPWIQEQTTPEFRRLMENAVRRAVRAAKKEGK